MHMSFSPHEHCTMHLCTGHESTHHHGMDCGHERVLHDDHFDYVVEGHLHYVHEGHCDDHGSTRDAI